MDRHVPAGAPADLFITEVLDTRVERTRDYSAEARAIQAYAVAVAENAEAILPNYVKLALQLTGTATGGLSLLEPSPAPGFFRWHFLEGRLSVFTGAATPRNYSPCGVTLDRNRPVLTLHPERVYSWLVDAGVELPEVLLVPLRRGDKSPFGTLWVVSDVEGLFTREDATTLTEIAECIGVAAAGYAMSAIQANSRDGPKADRLNV